PIAEKLLTVHNDPEGMFLLAEGSVRLGQCGQALEVYTRHAGRLLATDSTKMLASLHTMIARVRDDSGALEELLQLLNKAGDSTHVNEVSELLAHASVQDGNLERARDLYQMLAAAEPQNAVHQQNYDQVVERMEGEGEGAAPANGITAEEGSVIVEELEATAPVIDQFYPDPIAIAVRSAVTDADLFLSYNLPDKAIVPLLGALPQAPRDVRLNQRLAALHTRFQRFTEAAVCCRTLESVYHDAGYPDEAVRYGELAARYEQSAEAVPSTATLSTAASPAIAAPALVSPDAVPPEPAAAAASPAPWPMAAPEAPDHDSAAVAHREFAVPEMTVHAHSDEHDPASDISSEWEQSLSVDDPAPAAEVPATVEADASSNPEIAETVEEIRFYLEHYMTDQARAGIEKLESLTSDARILDPLRAAVESGAEPVAEPEPEITEINADEPADFEVERASVDGSEAASTPGLRTGHHHETPDHAPVDLTPEPAHAEVAHAESSDQTALVADLEASLGDSFPQAQPPVAPLPDAQPLPGWPTAPAAARSPERQPEPVASFEGEIPAPAATRANAASAAGAATAPAPTMSYSPAPVRPLGAGAQAMHASDSVDLSEMFGELKQELEEEVAAGDDDPDTHYNLGVAFREMGLLDEAIAELQKVCNAIERGKPFSQPVQTYTWLAQCFLDKGVPDAAIRW